MDHDSGRQLTTVGTTVDVLRGLQELHGAGVTELAEHLNLSKGAVHNHLSTLKRNRLVAKEDDEYRLGYQFISLGEYVKKQSLIYTAGKGETDQLADETGEYAHLMAEEFGQGIHLYKAQGEKAVGEPYHVENLQKMDHLHYSAAGKAILSRLSDDKIRSIIEEYGLPRRTENTIVSKTKLFTEIERVREHGYAFNDEEEIQGLRAVAAPIDADRTSTVGAISVSGPVQRMGEKQFRETLPEIVSRVANVIEVNIETAQQ